MNLAYFRIYGWGKKSERIKEGIKDVRFQRKSILSTISVFGVNASLVFDGTLNSEVFTHYLEFVLFPTLKKDEIIVMDNCSVHKSKLVREVIERLGINVLYLPPYSPDLNPIELMWAAMKGFLRKLRARTKEKLIEAIGVALELVSKVNIVNWFKHCGYIVKL